MFNTKEKKSLAFLVGGLILLEVGSPLLNHYFVIGLTIGVMGIVIFGYGIYLSVETVVKTIKQIKVNFINKFINR